MPPKRPRPRGKSIAPTLSDVLDDSQATKRVKPLPSSAIDPTTAPATMPAIKAEVDPITTMGNPVVSATEPAQHAQNEATRAIVGVTEVHPTRVDAPAPLFKIGELVRFTPRYVNVRQGGTIVAAIWKETSSEFVYEIHSKNIPHGTNAKDVPEAQITSSSYTVDDVVEVVVFDKQVRRTILQVLVSAAGVFTYDVGGGFEARDKDVLNVAGRRR